MKDRESILFLVTCWLGLSLALTGFWLASPRPRMRQTAPGRPAVQSPAPPTRAPTNALTGASATVESVNLNDYQLSNFGNETQVRAETIMTITLDGQTYFYSVGADGAPISSLTPMPRNVREDPTLGD